MNLDTTLRSGVGRALIAAGRHLSRTGARLLGHPSGEKVRPLRAVPTADPVALYRSLPARQWPYDPEDTA